MLKSIKFSNKELALEKLLDYFSKYPSGEAIYQLDNAQFDALELLEEILDDCVEVKFENEENELA